MQMAPRVAYAIATDADPGPLFVMHSCDNPRCVTPGHLSLGTAQDNIADRNQKGRQARGERMGSARLTREAVVSMREQRANGVGYRTLARAHGVDHKTVMKACQGKTWGHL